MDEDRRYWPKVSLPQDLHDLIVFVAARREGLSKDELHLLIFDALAEAYPDDVATLSMLYESEWMAGRFNKKHRKPPTGE